MIQSPNQCSRADVRYEVPASSKRQPLSLAPLQDHTIPTVPYASCISLDAWWRLVRLGRCCCVSTYVGWEMVDSTCCHPIVSSSELLWVLLEEVGYDPEPWQCRCIDSKKWRCSKETHPDPKYCKCHMRHGCNQKACVESSKTTLLGPHTRRSPGCSYHTPPIHLLVSGLDAEVGWARCGLEF